MESKFSAGMFTGLGNFLISSECFRFISQLLVTMHVQWLVHYHFYSLPIHSKSVQLILFVSGVFSLHCSFCLMQMTVLVVYIFLYGRVYLVIDIFIAIWTGNTLFHVFANGYFCEYMAALFFYVIFQL